MLERIPFSVFFFNTKDRISLDLVKVLNPFDGDFYKCGNVYLQIDNPQDDHLNITMAIGTGPDFMRALRNILVNGNVNKISFLTSEENLIVHRIAEYYGFKKISVENNYYGEFDAWYYELLKSDYIKSKRFKCQD